jgi:hypothetical protein
MESRVNDVPVEPFESLGMGVRKHHVSLAIVTVPAHAVRGTVAGGEA